MADRRPWHGKGEGGRERGREREEGEDGGQQLVVTQQPYHIPHPTTSYIESTMDTRFLKGYLHPADEGRGKEGREGRRRRPEGMLRQQEVSFWSCNVTWMFQLKVVPLQPEAARQSCVPAVCPKGRRRGALSSPLSHTM